MEDALALATWVNMINNCCGLNPCFNGRCTRTAAFDNVGKVVQLS